MDSLVPSSDETDDKSIDPAPEVIEILDELPEQYRKLAETAVQISVQQVTAEYYSGPLPPPRILAQYKDILPDLPDRLFSMAEKQQEHRHEMEKAVVFSNIRNELLGTLSGPVVAITLLILGAIIILAGKSIEGLITLGGSALAFVSSYITARNKHKKELEEKARTLEQSKQKPASAPSKPQPKPTPPKRRTGNRQSKSRHKNK